MSNRIAATVAAAALVVGVLIGVAGTFAFDGVTSRGSMEARSMMGGSMMGGSMMGGSMMGGSMMGGSMMGDAGDMWEMHTLHHGEGR